MTITHVLIRNFQSLRSVDLDLGAFTVIVGPSSSGKSALIRAFRALASNVRGTGMITRGQKDMAITAHTDTHVVTLERGERHSAYRLNANGTELIFTKLGGEVPEHVTNALRLDPGADSINFAGQFDKPYLLDESGATIARQLGELTNVNALFEAVGRANRVRNNAASTLKTRKNDLEQIKFQMVAFRDLPDKLRIFAEVEALDEQRRAISSRIGRLESTLRTLRILERALAKSVVYEVPDATELTEAMNRYLDLKSKLQGLAAKQQRAAQLIKEVSACDDAVERAADQLQTVLHRAGVCPTCGRPTR